MQVLYLGDALKVVEVSPEGDEGTPVLLVLKRVEEEEVEVAERRERPVVSAVGHCPMGYRPSESAVQTLKSAIQQTESSIEASTCRQGNIPDMLPDY